MSCNLRLFKNLMLHMIRSTPPGHRPPKNPCNLPKAATPIKRSAAFRGRSSLDKLFWTQSSTSLAVLGARLIPMDQVLSINFKWDKLDSELGENKPQIILHLPPSLDFTGLLPRLHPVAVGEAAVGSLDKSTPCTACCPAKLLGAGIAADPNIPTCHVLIYPSRCYRLLPRLSPWRRFS